MTAGLIIAMALCALLPGRSLAHELHHSIHEARAVSVEFVFADGDPFSFQSYEIYRAGDETPVQVGKTDARGRVAFIPDRAGEWHIKAFSENGHGADFSFTTGAEGAVEETNKSLLERHLRIISGVCIIFGFFGLVSLFARGGRRS